MNLEPDDNPPPITALGEVIADLTIVARQLEALAQSTDLLTPAIARLLGVCGGLVKADVDRLGRQILPVLAPPALVVKDGEGEAAAEGGIVGEPPPAEAPTPTDPPAEAPSVA